MNDKMTQALFHDFSVGTEAFRDDLLERCLAELGSENKTSGWNLVNETRELDDNELELLAAAGDPSLFNFNDNK